MDGRTNLADRDIRQPLHKWLAHAHAHDPSTSILHEFKVPRPSARVDLAVVNGEIAAYEIKSDLDTLTRLKKQVPAYSRVFDKICLVTTERHLRTARAAIPSWWGLTIARQKDGEIELRNVKKLKRNPNPELGPLLHALFVPELRFVLHSCAPSSRRPSQKDDLIAEIIRISDIEDVRGAVRCILKRRYSVAAPSGDALICR
jgi:hypothetical protein